MNKKNAITQGEKLLLLVRRSGKICSDSACILALLYTRKNEMLIAIYAYILSTVSITIPYHLKRICANDDIRLVILAELKDLLK